MKINENRKSLHQGRSELPFSVWVIYFYAFACNKHLLLLLFVCYFLCSFEMFVKQLCEPTFQIAVYLVEVLLFLPIAIFLL